MDEDGLRFASGYRKSRKEWLGIMLSFTDKERRIKSPFPGKFKVIIDTDSRKYGGNGDSGILTKDKKSFLLSETRAVVGRYS